MGSLPGIYAYMCVNVCVCKCFYCPTVSIRMAADGEAVPYTIGVQDNTRTSTCPHIVIQYAAICKFPLYFWGRFFHVSCPSLVPHCSTCTLCKTLLGHCMTYTSICGEWVTLHWGQYAHFILEDDCFTSERTGLICVIMWALTWLLGRQSQLWVQVWTVVRIYPAFILLSSTTNPVQTYTWKQWQK